MNETCPKCHVPLRPGTAFCTKCGRRQHAPARPPPAAASHAAPAEAVPKSGRRSHRPLVIILSVLAVIAALVLAPSAWQFAVGFGRGLSGLTSDGTQPHKTPTSPVVQPAMPPPTPALTRDNPNTPPDETYTIPRTNKKAASIAGEYSMDIQRAAQCLNTHADLGQPLTSPRDWKFTAAILWTEASQMQELSRTGPPAQRAHYGEWARNMAHLCHLLNTEPDVPRLQHYRIKLVYAASKP